MRKFQYKLLYGSFLTNESLLNELGAEGYSIGAILPGTAGDVIAMIMQRELLPDTLKIDFPQISDAVKRGEVLVALKKYTDASIELKESEE